jgi:hypothetical protein
MRFQKGHTMSPEMRQKISLKLKGRKKNAETILKMRKAQKGRQRTSEQIRKHRESMIGKKASLETRIKMSQAQSGERGNKWKGGITPLYLQIRSHFKSRQWSSDCFTRDNFTCQQCGERGGKLNCHHVKYFSEIILDYSIENLEDALDCDELWNINNGVTLCKNCHSLIHKKNV